MWWNFLFWHSKVIMNTTVLFRELAQPEGLTEKCNKNITMRKWMSCFLFFFFVPKLEYKVMSGYGRKTGTLSLTLVSSMKDSHRAYLWHPEARTEKTPPMNRWIGHVLHKLKLPYDTREAYCLLSFVITLNTVKGELGECWGVLFS